MSGFFMLSDEQVQERAQAISDNYPLVFDPESDWGVSMLEAVAVLDLVAQRDPQRWTVAQRQVNLDLMIEALQAYRQDLEHPVCYMCGASLTRETIDVFGGATWCPDCGQVRTVRRTQEVK